MHRLSHHFLRPVTVLYVFNFLLVTTTHAFYYWPLGHADFFDATIQFNFIFLRLYMLIPFLVNIDKGVYIAHQGRLPTLSSDPG